MDKKLFHDFLAKIEEDLLSSEECAMIEGGASNSITNNKCTNNCNCYLNTTCTPSTTNDGCTNNCYCKEDDRPPIIAT